MPRSHRARGVPVASHAHAAGSAATATQTAPDGRTGHHEGHPGARDRRRSCAQITAPARRFGRRREGGRAAEIHSRRTRRSTRRRPGRPAPRRGWLAVGLARARTGARRRLEGRRPARSARAHRERLPGDSVDDQIRDRPDIDRETVELDRVDRRSFRERARRTLDEELERTVAPVVAVAAVEPEPSQHWVELLSASGHEVDVPGPEVQGRHECHCRPAGDHEVVQPRSSRCGDHRNGHGAKPINGSGHIAQHRLEVVGRMRLRLRHSHAIRPA